MESHYEVSMKKQEPEQVQGREVLINDRGEIVVRYLI